MASPRRPRRAAAAALTTAVALALPAAAAGVPAGSTSIVSAPAGTSTILAPAGHGVPGYGRTLSTDGSVVLVKADGAATPGVAGVDPDGSYAVVRDRTAGTTTVASRADGADGAPVEVISASLSADGDWVAFVSGEAGIVPGVDPEDERDHVYLRRRSTGRTYLVDRRPGGAPGEYDAGQPSVGVVGGTARVAFVSADPALVSGVVSSPGTPQVYVRTVDPAAPDTVTTVLASGQDGSATAAGDQSSFGPVISANGAYVAFESASDNLAGAVNVLQIYRRQLAGGGLTLVSQKTRDGSQPGNGVSFGASISDDGARIAYTTTATNLTGTADANGVRDVVLWLGDDPPSAVNVLQSRSGATQGNADSDAASVSPDGNSVAFNSRANTLVPETAGLPVGTGHVLLVVNGAAPVLVDRLAGPSGAIADGPSLVPNGDLAVGLAQDATFAVYGSTAPNLAAAVNADAGSAQTYGRTIAGGQLTAISSAASDPPGLADAVARPFGGALSTGGRFAAYSTASSVLTGPAPGGVQQVVLRNMVTGASSVVSRATGAAGAPADSNALSATVSADGRYVAFVTAALSLGVSGGNADVFVRDTTTQTTTRLTTNAGVEDAQISADGRFVVLSTTTGLVAADGNGQRDAYVVPAGGGTPVLASRATGADGAVSTRGAARPAISADGSRVLFGSDAKDLGTANAGGFVHLYVRDLTAATTQLVDRGPGADGAVANASEYAWAISGDGTKVAFQTTATNLGDAGLADVVLRDLEASTTRSVLRSSGNPTEFNVLLLDHAGTHLGLAGYPDIGTVSGPPQVYVQDLVSGVRTLASRADGAGGAKASSGAFGFSLSPDGGCVAFTSGAGGLTAAQPAGTSYLRVWLRAVGTDCPAAPAGGGGGTGGGGTGGTGGGGGTTGGGGTIGPGTGTPTGPGPGTTRDRTAPVLRSLKATPRAFRLGASTKLSFTLNEAAKVRLSFARQDKGRKRGKRCVQPTPKLARARPCIRSTIVGALTQTARAGATTIRFKAKIGRRTLKAGVYLVRVIASDAAGNASKVQTLRLTVRARTVKRRT